MNTRRSRPSSSMPTGAGTPSNPARRTERRKAWIEPECGLAGRRTCAPARTTSPAWEIPPSSGRSAMASALPDLVGREVARAGVGERSGGAGAGRLVGRTDDLEHEATERGAGTGRAARLDVRGQGLQLADVAEVVQLLAHDLGRRLGDPE